VKNLEFKAAVGSIAEAEGCARALGAEKRELLVQRDTYFRVPEGRLKLRELGGQTAELIAYQREDASGARWSSYTRYPVGDASTLRKMLAETLGVVAVVKKSRQLYMLGNARIHLDTVEGLGTFVEFEVVGEETSATQPLMRRLREGFRLQENSGIPGSYADLMLSNNRASPGA
jgi:predicted adenylyl cyclase CyaB